MNLFESTFDKHKKLALAKLNENAPVETAEYEFPSHWASYLVNNDASGLEDGEQADADAAIQNIEKELNASVHCVDVEELGFKRQNDYNDMGGDVSKYTFHVHRKINEDESLTPAEVKQYKIKFGEMLKKDLGSFVAELKQAISDPKVQQFLLAAQQDGTDGDDLIDVKESEVSVLSLIPTQNEVFLEKSLDYPLNTQPSNISSYIETGKGKMLRIVVSGNYVIDGHHRWSQIYCLNKNGMIPVYDITFPGSEDPTTILKKIHLGIAATRKELPTTGGEATDTDLFKVSEKGFADWIHKNVDNNAPALQEFRKVESTMKSKLNEADEASGGDNAQFVSNVVIPYLWSNVSALKSKPGAYPRAIMPQTEKGGDKKIDTFINTMKSGNINVDPQTENKIFESTFKKFRDLYTK